MKINIILLQVSFPNKGYQEFAQMYIWAYSYEFGPIRGAGNLPYLKALDYWCNLISRSENPNYF